MITVATLLWDANDQSFPFSRMYDEAWVEKLYNGVARNLSAPFKFVCYSERPRSFHAPIDVRQMQNQTPGYGDCIQPYELNAPMILMGLDTVITGNIDHLADYCMRASLIALPRDPYKPQQACNGVALVPGGNGCVWSNWAGENDMDWMRAHPHAFIDDLFPGHVVSYKGEAEAAGLRDARIVYFHGLKKPHELPHVAWISEHWK